MNATADIKSLHPCVPGMRWLDIHSQYGEPGFLASCPRAEFILWYLCKRNRRAYHNEYREFCRLCAEPFDHIVPWRVDQAEMLTRMGLRMAFEIGRKQPFVAACGVSQCMTMIAVFAVMPKGEDAVGAVIESEQLRQADILRGLIQDPYSIDRVPVLCE